MSEKKILIIDDDPDIVKAMRTVLESQGYKIRSAANNAEGRKEVEAFVPDIIILDVMMEAMCDGFDLAREFKTDAKLKSIPILMLTAVKEKTGFDFSREAGDDAWLPVEDFAEKPVSPEALLSKVKQLISKK